MAIGQQWSTAAKGGNLTSETLSRTYRLKAFKKFRWRQFCRVDLALGMNNGDYYTFRKGGALKDLGQVVGEFDDVPETEAEERSGTVKVEERTNSNPYTERLSLFAKLSVEDISVRRLKDNMVKTLDTMCGYYFRKSEICYTPRGTAGTPEYALVQDGNPTLASSREFAYWDLKNLVDLARHNYDMPPWENEGYFFVCCGTVARSLKDDNALIDILKYHDPGRVLNGEIGKVYGNIRVIEETNLLKGDMTNGCGEGVLIAWDAVVEAMSYAEEIQAAKGDMWARRKSLRWVTYLGWDRVYNFSQDDGEDRTIRVCEDGMEIA